MDRLNHQYQYQNYNKIDVILGKIQLVESLFEIFEIDVIYAKISFIRFDLNINQIAKHVLNKNYFEQ